MLRLRPALRWLTAALLPLAIAACTPEKPVFIDGSSAEAFARTAAAARRELPVGDRVAFDRALRTVGGRRLANRDPDALARITFDGMTGAQVVADQRAREK